MTYALIAATIVLHACICLLAADFLAGVVHWAEDTWLRPGISPLLDKWVVLPNLEHHQRPGGIHYWGHCGTPPRAIALLQRLGVLQPAAHHALHHKRPYGVRYCTTTTFLNPVLDRIGFWRGLERIAERCGARVHRATPARGGY
ncbi:MAG TPA: fatty acid desaturase CarF family protein [Candidatus Sulfotelmatobacter sp.]|nr:fatty acid desaturase CarF family protein [Candidatus Sulfotelmatobacter sp.]